VRSPTLELKAHASDPSERREELARLRATFSWEQPNESFEKRPSRSMSSKGLVHFGILDEQIAPQPTRFRCRHA
jgi:CRISPR/Cas system-associated protein Cas10 (large subunit of type III CRISPR-Cas system)